MWRGKGILGAIFQFAGKLSEVWDGRNAGMGYLMVRGGTRWSDEQDGEAPGQLHMVREEEEDAKV